MPLPASLRTSGLFGPLILGVAVPLMLLAASGFLGMRYWHQQQAASHAVEHSRHVLDTLDRLRANIADLEVERRGYLLTLDATYLKHYGVSDESLRREGDALQNLVADDPLQSLRAAHLALTVSAKLREIDDVVKTAHTSGADPALARIGTMGEIRSQIDQMVDHERFLLAGWETGADALEQRKTWLIASAVVIVTVFAVGALALARLEARRRRKTTAENVQLHGDLEARDKKIRRLVDANIIGIIIWDIEGRILEANDAFLRMTLYDRDDLASGRLDRRDLTPAEWRDRDERTVAELKTIGTVQPFEKEYFRKDGSRLPVLSGGALFEASGNQGVSFVLDLTERKRAEAEARESERRYRETLAGLAHANRLNAMGQLTASIAHEVNQPIAAAVLNAEAALNWLGAQPSNLDKVREALRLIVADATRAGNVVAGIRALIQKVPARRSFLDINEAIREVITLTRGEAVKAGVSVQTDFADGLPLIYGDRVQLQQVILNLIINAIEAMSGVAEIPRALLISTAQAEHGILVAMRDSGPGLDPASLEHLFNAFYTTKSGGMGMGLAICRSIIEAHEGQLYASANEPRGAVFQFTLPLQRDETLPAEHAGPMPAA
ncbi:PAS domain S-box-containing protein [Bradyrhizobium erythrophlei]|uniref:histidine kinase n=1 Tax=Bradyrhizobium erythrophlei TaxID=1437360 RepID=A0A1M5GDT5_9BRAD|nr:PAS domain S-box-containing protein [Bradyrhizobium erythrophlei]